MERILMKYGGQTLSELISSLNKQAIHLNRYGEELLNHPDFLVSQGERIVTLCVVTLEEIGLSEGANLPALYRAAQKEGFQLCDLETAIYFSLNYQKLTNSHDLKSKNKAPKDSITIATQPLEKKDTFPKGFYVRRVDGVNWLRGYLCDEEHLFSGKDSFLFKVI